jgi:hypothetical protein
MLQAIIRFIPMTVFVLAIGLVIFLNLKGCNGSPEPFDGAPMPQDEVLNVQVKDNFIHVRTKEETVSSYVPSHGSADVKVNDKGEVTVDVKNKGFYFSPAIGVLMTSKLDAVVAAELGYWNRFELVAGVSAPRWAAFGGIGYRLDQIRYLKNTSIYIAYTSRKEVGAGLMVRF